MYYKTLKKVASGILTGSHVNEVYI